VFERFGVRLNGKRLVGDFDMNANRRTEEGEAPPTPGGSPFLHPRRAGGLPVVVLPAGAMVASRGQRAAGSGRPDPIQHCPGTAKIHDQPGADGHGLP
jgi:hypothetical protein